MWVIEAMPNKESFMKRFLVIALLLGVWLCFVSCSKSNNEKGSEETTLIGKWRSFQLSVMDEFGYNATDVVGDRSLIVEFTDEKATFGFANCDYYQADMPRNKESTYVVDSDGSLVFQQLYNETGFEAVGSMQNNILIIQIGNRSWDWYDRWFFEKVK